MLVMKRLAGVLAGAFLLVMSLAGSALAQTYPASPSPTTVVEGGGGNVGGAGGTAFTGSSVSTALVLLGALVVLGAVALFVARRRSAHEAG
jgi:LPXTG-motif cell wall-anchored protein